MATVQVIPGQVLIVDVGGRPATNGVAGWNGGGWSYQNSMCSAEYGGAGASDLRVGGPGLSSRILVAGGGAGQGVGATASAGNGGAGGGMVGAAGISEGGSSSGGGGGGTQSAGGTGGTAGQIGNAGSPGTFAIGGTSGPYGCTAGGGGGGGYYGGGGGGGGFYGAGGGGGGSSYADPSTSQVIQQQGVNAGNGQVIIAYPDFAAVGGALAAMEEAANNPSEHWCAACHGDPVNTATGSVTETYKDLAIPGRLPLDFERSYSSLMAGTNGPLGYGWTFSYGMSLGLGSGLPPATVTVNQENGTQVSFTWSGNAYTTPPRVLASLVHNADGTFTFIRQARQIFTFSLSGQLTAEKDLNGYTTTLGYNGSGQLTTVTDPAGRTLTLGWTGGLITSLTDSANRTVSYQYNDGAGDLTDVIDANGGHTQFSFDSSHRLVTIRAPKFYGDNTPTPVPVTTNHYNGAGQVDWQTDPVGNKTSFAYTGYSTTITDPNGNLTVEQYRHGVLLSTTKAYGTALAATWSYTYDPATFGLTSVTDPNGHSTTATYDGNGNKTSQTDPVGNKTTWTYDALDDVTATTDPAGVTTNATYDVNGNLLSTSTPLIGSNPAVSRTASYTYADTPHPGDVTSMMDPDGKVWSYGYDTYGDRSSTSDPLGDKTTDGYDTIGRRTSEVAPDGNVTGANPAIYTTAYTYDTLGHLLTSTDPLGHKTTKAYDANGNLISITDPNNHQTTYIYDAGNRLTVINRSDSTTLSNSYDGDGNQTSQTDAKGNATTYTYDAVNRLSSVSDPNNRTTSYTYDRGGNRITQQQPAGNCGASPKTGCTSYTYDIANRLTGITYSDGATPNVTYAYDADGRRTTMTDGTGTTTNTWDSVGRLIASTNGAGTAVGYSYDLAGHITTVAYPGSVNLTRSYDDAGRLAGLTDWLGNTTGFGYDANSNLISQTDPNGTTVARSVNAADQLTGISDSASGVTFASYTYTRDNNGQLATTTAIGVGPASETYTYNPLNQLTAVNTAGYGYDAGDNLTNTTSGTNQLFDAANQLCWSAITTGSGCATPPTGAITYNYDARGNRTATTPPGGSGTTYGYDQANRLTNYSNGTATYTYNGDGLRMTKTLTGTTTPFVWDTAEGLPQLLTDGTSNYIYGPTGVIEQITGTTPTYLYQDQLGSTRALTNATGTVIGSYAYDAYGNTTTHNGATTVIGYAGQFTDPESGLIYLRARYYDPATAQFLTRDPAAALTRSAYGYAADNPLNHTDPSGLWLGIDDAVASAVGAVVGATTSVVEQAVQGGGINWSKVGIAAGAGAAGGEATLYCGPACGGAVAGAVNDAANQLYDNGTVNPARVAASAALGGAVSWLGGGMGEAPLPSQVGVGVVLGFAGDFYVDWAYGNLWNSDASAAELSNPSCNPGAKVQPSIAALLRGGW